MLLAMKVSLMRLSGILTVFVVFVFVELVGV